jgi:hypothetical protein
VDGQQYTLEIFYAQRQSVQSIFRLRTTLVLDPLDQTSVSAMYD